MNIVVFNLGNRDLYFKEPVTIGERVFTSFIDDYTDFRTYSEYVLEHYGDFQEKIHFPIIEATLKKIIAEKVHINEIVLFASDQHEAHNQDTIYIAEIIKKYLMKLKTNEQYKPYLNELRKPTIQVTNMNPSDVDLMSHFYENKLPNITKRVEEIKNIYFSITSGTQAMNTMMMLVGLNYFQAKAHLIYYSYNADTPYFLQVGKKIMRKNFLDQLRRNVQTYDYFAAIEELKEFSDDEITPRLIDNLSLLLEFAHLRSSFNFEKAKIKIKRLIDQNPRHRSEFEGLNRQINDLTAPSTENMHSYMEELYWSMWVLYRKGQFIDFCGRLFRFLEQSLYQIVIVLLNVPLNEKGDKIDETWLLDNQDLINWFKNYKDARPKGIDYTNTITRKTLESTIDYYISQGKQELESINNQIRVFDRLAKVRNKSPLAHGFTGVSEEVMFEEIKKDLNITHIEHFENALFSNIKSIYSGVFGNENNLDNNSYEQMNKVIMKFIDDIESDISR